MTGRRPVVACAEQAGAPPGAQDTWEKVLDGTLRGASIGASNVEWRTERREGREVPVARRYDLVELSLVDLPSNPDALGVTFVRDGVPLAEVLDELEESSPPTPPCSAASRGGGTDCTAEDTETAESGPGPVGETVEQRRVPLPRPLPVAQRRGEGSRAAARLVALGAPDYVQLTPFPPGEGNDEGSARLAALRASGHVERATAIGSPLPRHPQDESAESAASERAAYCGMPGRQLFSPPRDEAAEDREGTEAERISSLTSASFVSPAVNLGVRHERAQGPYSNNPDGPPDMGVPARAEERPTATVHGSYGQTPEGNREAVFHTAARGILLGCGCLACQAALAALDSSPLAATEERRDEGVRTALVTRALEAHTRRLEASIQAVHGRLALVGQLAGTLGQIERRVAAIEVQPMPGGPQLRVADKTHALLPHGGQSGVAEQLRALEGLAGRLTDPQAQIAVATEMIRLQQEAGAR